jgi:3-deoxy-D-manno-octulosonic-acid transferase
MRVLYKVATGTYVSLLKIAATFNPKAKLWVDGRKNFKQEVQSVNIDGPLIWFHCASLGEFEQGKPVMEAYKKRHPDWLLLVTFFSPSGYEIQKDFSLADFVYYLPTETNSNIKFFLEKFKPKIAVFVKYEFWYDYMAALYKRRIPLIFISSSFRSEQVFFKFYGNWFLNQLKNVEMFFVQNALSKELLESHGISKVEISGDTRFDRVLNTVNADEEIQFLEQFKYNQKIMIFGSAWKHETEFALKILKQLPEDWKVIFAPHEINDQKIEQFISDSNEECVKFTELDNANSQFAKVLVLNTVGHLARIYKYTDIAIVGGGFNDGIHNILEPLAFGVPVFFGKNHYGFNEAKETIDRGIGFEVESFDQFVNKALNLMNSNEELKKVQSASAKYIVDNGGATNKISAFLNKLGQIISCQIC